MRRVLVLLLVMVSALTAAGCSSSGDSDGATGDPMNAIVELGRPVDLGYDRTGWDPAAQAEAMAVAQRITATSVGCIDPAPTGWPDFLSTWQKVKMPMPAAVVQCFSTDDEDITTTAFADEDHKNTYIEAKAELICGRALAPLEPGGPPSNFNGIVYVDLGNNIIVEPDSTEVRDQLVEEIGGTPAKMCADAVGDQPATAATIG